MNLCNCNVNSVVVITSFTIVRNYTQLAGREHLLKQGNGVGMRGNFKTGGEYASHVFTQCCKRFSAKELIIQLGARRVTIPQPSDEKSN
jgi:hypothetical protein